MSSVVTGFSSCTTLIKKIRIDGFDVTCVNVTFAVLCVDILRYDSQHFAVRDIGFDDVFRVRGRICYYLSLE